MRQGDPGAAFLFVILFTVVVDDAEAALKVVAEKEVVVATLLLVRKPKVGVPSGSLLQGRRGAGEGGAR